MLTKRWKSECITGKERPLGGGLMKPQAPGFGLEYYVRIMMGYKMGSGGGWEEKRVAISNSRGTLLPWVREGSVRMICGI